MKSMRLIIALAVCLFAAVAVMAQEATPETGAAGQSQADLPTVTLEYTAEGFNLPADFAGGAVQVTFQNSGDADIAPVLARLTEGMTLESLQEAAAQDPFSAIMELALLGGTTVPAGESKDVTFLFTPGQYVLINFAGEMPEILPFTVTEGDAAAALPEGDLTVRLVDFAFSFPLTVNAGEQTWNVVNEGGQWHEMAIFSIPDDMTVSEYRDLLMSDAEPPETVVEQFVLLPLTSGEQAAINLNLEPGTYVVSCFLPDFASGSAHNHLGMVQIFTVTEGQQ